MIKQFLLAAIALLSVACGNPDARQADVVVTDARLMGPAWIAANFWSEATGGDVNLNFVNHCNQNKCITLSIVPSVKGQALTRRDDSDPTEYTASIKLDEKDLGTRPELYVASLIAHELGHVFWLEHTDAIEGIERVDAEVMTEYDFGNDEGHACIGPQTCKQYRNEYDDKCNVTCW